MDFAGLFSLEGRVALVTGASGTPVTASHASAVCEALAAELGSRAVAVPLDVAQPDAIAPAFAAAEAAFGAPCDVIVDNAGIAVTQPALEHTTEAWDAVTGVNLRGAFLVAQEGARRLVAAGRPGAIVTVASILGLRVAAGVAAYAAAKAGLIQLTRALAVERARHRIRINALAPDYVETGMNRALFATDSGQAMIRRIPQRRLGTPTDLTGPLLLLASEASAHMTGAVVTVDGGHSINPL